MHELSIVMSIVGIAEQQARAAGAGCIEEIELEIGELSGVEMQALDFAWKEGVRQTLLEHATRTIIRIKGQANCLDCGTDFPIQHYYDACPVCGGHFIRIKSGQELRVKALVVN